MVTKSYRNSTVSYALNVDVWVVALIIIIVRGD